MTNILQKLAENHLSLSLLMFNSPLLWVGWLSGGAGNHNVSPVLMVVII